MKEELYKWYPIIDEGEYWTEYDISVYRNGVEKTSTIVTNGKDIWTYPECNLSWSTVAKQGDWKYMRINIEDISCREESVFDKDCRFNIN